LSGIFNHRAKKAWRIVAGAAALLAIAPIGSASAQSLASAGQTPNQVAVGAGLDAVSGRTNTARQTQIDAIRALPIAARGAALGQLSPQSYTLLPRLAIQSMDANETMLHNYIVARRSIAGDAPATVPLSGDGTINMTLMGDLRQATYKADPDRPRVTTDSRSIAFAVDFSPIPGTIVGVTGGIDGIDARLDPARPRINSFNSHIGPYASIVRGKVYLDTSASYNRSEYKLRRQIGFTGFGDQLHVNQDGDGVAASAETGYMLKHGVAEIQPFAGIHYRYADVSGFQEIGGIAALDVASYRTKSLRSSLGARVSLNVKRGGWTLRPTAQGEWRRELLKNPESRMEFRFADGDVPTTFTLVPAQINKTAAYITAGLTATRNSRTSFRLAYTGELSGDRHVNGFSATISRRF
jgi:uncharacterized protein with beta-barrel porin domain